MWYSNADFKKIHNIIHITDDICYNTLTSYLYKDNVIIGNFYIEEQYLKNYKVIERKPICINYKIYDICGMGPPSSGGIAVAQIFKILENLPCEFERVR